MGGAAAADLTARVLSEEFEADPGDAALGDLEEQREQRDQRQAEGGDDCQRNQAVLGTARALHPPRPGVGDDHRDQHREDEQEGDAEGARGQQQRRGQQRRAGNDAVGRPVGQHAVFERHIHWMFCLAMIARAARLVTRVIAKRTRPEAIRVLIARPVDSGKSRAMLAAIVEGFA